MIALRACAEIIHPNWTPRTRGPSSEFRWNRAPLACLERINAVIKRWFHGRRGLHEHRFLTCLVLR